VREAIRIILSDSNVKGILINIFGGIVKCDLIALGLIEAIKEIGLSIPVVVRLEGNNAQKGKDELENSGLKVVGETDLDKAVKKIIELTRG
jgi:succinyl-CoA synthetase beta subunit